MNEITPVNTSDMLKNAVNSLIKSALRQPGKDLARQPAIKNLRYDKALPFAFFLDLETRTVDFVIDQVLIRDLGMDNRGADIFNGNQQRVIHERLKDQIHAFEDKMIVNDDDSLAQLFGFDSERKRKTARFSKEDRFKQKKFKNFITANELKPSNTLRFFQKEAEYANYMMTYVANSKAWDHKDINLHPSEFDIVSKLLSIIRDFCQLDLMKSKVDDWDNNHLVQKKSNREQKERIKGIRESVEQSYKLRYAALVVLQDAFDKFLSMEEELNNVADLMDFEHDLSMLEDRSLDMEAQKEALVNSVQEAYLSGQAFESIALSVNSTVEDLLELETNVSSDNVYGELS